MPPCLLSPAPWKTMRNRWVKAFARRGGALNKPYSIAQKIWIKKSGGFL